MANALLHRIEILDTADCGTVAELMAAIENMGISLDLEHEVQVILLEETLSDGSKVQSVKLAARS